MARIKIRSRKDGGVSYTVTWVLGGGRTGTAPSASETFTSDARAESFRRDVERSGNQWPEGWVKGEGYVNAVEPTMLGVSFATVAEAYFIAQERRVKRGLKKQYTLHRDRQQCVIHLMPTFGTMQFTEIESGDVESWVDMQVDLGAAPKSIRNRHGLLFPIMAHGQKRMLLRPDNPCEITELPQGDSQRDFKFFQEGEWALVRSCMRRDVHQLVDLMLATAVRWGEVSALRVGDCTVADEETVHIEIVRAWSKRAPDDPAPIKAAQGENKSWKLGGPKNKRGRTVVAHGQVGRHLIAGIEGRRADEYIFLTREGNPWRYPDFHADRWKPAAAEAKARGLTKHPTIHMLRHTCVVWSLARGIPIGDISYQLGHSSIQITYDIYGGKLDLHDPKMAKAMANAMISVSQAITPGPTQLEVAARKIRPGGRGATRVRAG
jgi:integrase